jgi:hypothetical protein
MSTIQRYGVSSRDYLRRARARLDEETPEGLFYAAFELRAGVESRLQEYIEAQDRIQSRKKLGWHVAKLGKEMERMFRTGDKIVQLAILSDDGGTLLRNYYFTPVKQSLRKSVERIGEYLHAMRRSRAPDDPWWSRVRSFLEGVYAGLREATQGRLLGPPLMGPKGTRFNLDIEPEEGEKVEDLLREFVGTTRRVGVRYLDRIPDDPMEGA